MRESKRAFRQRQADRCLYKVQVGIAQSDMGGLICITPRQHVRFFGSLCSPGAGTCPPEPVGCGGYGCAYPTADPRKVVKFTHDPSDIASVRHAHGLKTVAEVYGVEALDPEAAAARPVASGELHPGTWAIIAERLEPIPFDRRFKGPINWALRCALDFSRDLDRANWPVPPRPGEHGYNEHARAIRHAREPRKLIEAGLQRCQRRFHEDIRQAGMQDEAPTRRFLYDVLAAWATLRRRGVRWTDMNSGNVGWSVRDGRWKVLDLGLTKRKPPKMRVFRGGR